MAAGYPVAIFLGVKGANIMQKNLAVFILCVILIGMVLSGCNTDGATQTQQTDEAQVTSETSPTPTEDLATSPTNNLINTDAPTLTPSPTASPTPTPLIFGETLLDILSIDIDNDGKEDELIISHDEEENMLRVRLDEEILETLTCNVFNFSSFTTKTKDEDKYLLLSYDGASSDYSTIIIAFDNNVPYILDTIAGCVDKVEGERVILICDMYGVGSWCVYIDFIIHDDCVEELTGDKEYVVSECYQPLVTAIDLEVEILEDGIYNSRNLEIGTAIYPIATDRYTYILFKLENGEEGRFFFTRDDYGFYINSINEFECFENVFYWD